MTTWKSAHQTKLVLWFGFWVVTVYGLFIVPWRGITDDYVDTAQQCIAAIFGADDARHTITVERRTDDPDHPYGSRIVIVNQALMNPDGSGPIRNVDFDTRVMCPATLLIALVLATPVSWRRRGWALLFGIPISCALGLLFLGFAIWDESSEISLVTFSPITKEIVHLARNVLTTQLSISAPILLWVLLTFRQEDFRKSLHLERKMVTA